MFTRILAVVILLCGMAAGQVGSSPTPEPKIQFFTNGGLPANGYKLCSYSAGTTTPLATYIAGGSGSTNTNPVILDSAGRANIWLGTAAYKLVLRTPGTDSTCATGTVVWTVDNISGYCSLSGCSFSGAVSTSSSISVNTTGTTGMQSTVTGTSGIAGAFTASASVGTNYGVFGAASNANSVGIVAQNSNNSGDIFQAQNAALSPIFRIKNASTTINNTLIATAESLTGQLTSTLATGTAPFVIASTTPVTNLTASPAAYDHAGGQAQLAHLVRDSCVLGTSCVVTLASSAVFSNANTYECNANDATAANAVMVNQIDGSHVTFTGTGTDTIRYTCTGN